jgi:hypothetical protein
MDQPEAYNPSPFNCSTHVEGGLGDSNMFEVFNEVEISTGKFPNVVFVQNKSVFLGHSSPQKA